MPEHHQRAAHRRAASLRASSVRVAPPSHPPERAHPPYPGQRRRLSAHARAALAGTRLIEIEHQGAACRLSSPPRDAGEGPIRLIPLETPTTAGSGSARRDRLVARRARLRRARRRAVLTVLLLSAVAAVAVLPRISRPAEIAESAELGGEPTRSAGAAALVAERADAPAVAPVPAPTLVTADVAIDPPVEVVADPDAFRGGDRTLDEGRAGARRDTYQVTSRAGEEATRSLVASEILVAPLPRIVAIGTKAPRDDSQATGRARHAPAGWEPGHAALGRATWYQYKSGTCAHNSLPKGTLVRVTNLDNERSTFCVVADRGIRDPANMIDLAHDVFDDLAPRSQGVLRARIEW